MGIIQAPVFILCCREEATSSSPWLPCILSTQDNGPIQLSIPGTASQSFQANHACWPDGPHISASLPFRCGGKKAGRESLWPLSVCTGCLSGVGRWDKGYFRLFLLLVWIAHDWFQKKKFISLQTYFYHLLEFLDALLTKCTDEPGLLQREMEGKMDNTLKLKKKIYKRHCQIKCSVTYKLWNGSEGLY